jgi:thiamine phosphate synthase YjbQ (UPF0047 family)
MPSCRKQQHSVMMVMVMVMVMVLEMEIMISSNQLKLGTWMRINMFSINQCEDVKDLDEDHVF